MRFLPRPNVSVDATFNPDFGQVESDPAVLDLSGFEVFQAERRPFFLEGAGQFNLAARERRERRPLSLATHRPSAAARSAARRRRSADRDHDSRRGEGHGPPNAGDVARRAVRGHGGGGGATRPAGGRWVVEPPRALWPSLALQRDFRARAKRRGAHGHARRSRQGRLRDGGGDPDVPPRRSPSRRSTRQPTATTG